MKTKAAFLLQFCLILMPALGSAAPPPSPMAPYGDISPAWVKAPLAEQQPNATLLFRKDSLFQDGSRLEFSHVLGGDKQAMAFRQQYEDMTRDYELRQNYSLLDPQQEQAHADQVTQFSRDLMSRVRMDQIHQSTRRMREAAMESQSLTAVRQPIGVVAGIAAVYSGEPMYWNLGDQIRVKARTAVRDSRGEVGMDSPVLNGKVELATLMPDHYTPDDPRYADGSQSNERVKVSLSRKLPMEISSGMSYGSSTGTMAASVSRPLSDHLTCVLDSVRPVHQMDYTPPTLSEQRVQLLYGISF